MMTERPFVAFNFAVELSVPGVSDEICTAAFQECDGLEMTLEVKSLREGGNHGVQYRLAGSVSYGNLTLKRGMTTASFDLWRWFDAITTQPSLRADGEVVVFAPDGRTERARYVLSRCLPVKLKAPPLNAKDGTVGIEELQLAYDSLSVKPGDGLAGLGSSGGGPGSAVGAGVGSRAGIGATAGISISGGLGA
jgi:phage tail-like protein